MTELRFFPASDPRVGVMGRVERTRENALRMGYPGVTLRVAFEGTSLAMRATSTGEHARFLVHLDGHARGVVMLPPGTSETPLAAELAPGEHALELVRLTEAWHGVVSVFGFAIGHGGHLVPHAPWPTRRLSFVGDSVTAGEGVDRTPERADAAEPNLASAHKALTANAYDAYAMVLARALDAQCELVCYGGRGLVRSWEGRTDVFNAPQLLELAVPAEDAPALSEHGVYVADAVVVSLGTNDFNLALPDFPEREQFVTAYVALVRRLRALHPEAHLFLTEGPMVNDEAAPARPQKTVLRAYIDETAALLADPRVHAVKSRHYPGDARDPHPTREQHAAIARDLEPIVRETLGW